MHVFSSKLKVEITKDIHLRVVLVRGFKISKMKLCQYWYLTAI